MTDPVDDTRPDEPPKTGSLRLVMAPEAASVQAARSEGVKAGDSVVVKLAPATGPINVPKPPDIEVREADGTVTKKQTDPMVAVALQRFLKNKTIRAMLIVLGLGLGRGGLVVVGAMNDSIKAGGHALGIAWTETLLKAFDKSWGFFVGSGAAMFFKIWDNNAVNAPAATKPDDVEP